MNANENIDQYSVLHSPVDHQLYFDADTSLLNLCPGEVSIELSMNDVEDTKGNNGKRGSLNTTNLRVIWTSSRTNYTNLSIGMNSISSVGTKTASSKLRGNTTALLLQVKQDKTRYEFVFTHLSNDSRLFNLIQSVHRAYQSSRLYRELKLRGAFLNRNKELELLPGEILECVVNSVWNLSNEQGHLGCFHVTSQRIVWQSVLTEAFNMSLPYMQILFIRSQESKYGKALVIETCEMAGMYVLGFRIDPPSVVPELAVRLGKLWHLCHSRPDFGVHVEKPKVEEPTTKQPFISQPQNIEEDVKIVDERELISPTLEARSQLPYQTDVDEGLGDIIYDDFLGVAIQRPKNPADTTRSLWRLQI